MAGSYARYSGLGSGGGGGGGSVNSVTASNPLFSSGGANPNISIQVATATQNGYLSSTTQSIGGDKDFFGNITFDGNLIINRSLTFTPAIDSTLTGSNQNIALHSQDYIIFTNTGLSSIASIANTVIASGHRINIVNQTGHNITIVNQFGSPPVGSANITTSFGTDLVLPNNGNAQLIYDTTSGTTWNLQNGTFIVQLDNPNMVSGTPAGINSIQINKFTLSPADIINKFVTLTVTPQIANLTCLDVIGGPEQDYGTDYTVSGSTLSWNGLFLDGVLTSGDKLVIIYY